MKLKGIKETCLYISDISESKKFYSNKLGLAVYNEVEESHIFFKIGNSMLLCFRNSATKKQEKLPPHFGEGHLHFAFETKTKDYDKWKKHLKAVGIEIEHEHQWPNGKRSIYFRDPDQHSVEIVEEGLWG